MVGCDGHSHAHAAGASQGSHNHGDHRADRGADARIEEVSLEDDRGGGGRRYVGADSAGANSSEAEANQRKLKRATAFVLVFFVVEIIGGVWSGSLAIISDAAHLLADVSGFILAMVANEIASRPACDKLTYGPVRAEVLSALFSTVTILAISLFLVVEAISRLIAFWKGEGEEIDGKLMSFIALLGLLVNLALLGIFGHEHGGHDHSHGHGHGHDHAHDDHDDHAHDDHDHNHDEEQGLVAAVSAKNAGKGVDERSSLFGSTGSSVTGAPGTPEAHTLDISGSSDASSVGAAAARTGGKGGGSIQYGSLVIGNRDEEEAALVATGVAQFPDLSVTGAGIAAGEKADEESERKAVRIKKKKTKNINMEAAVLHAVTDLVQSLGVLLAGLLIWYDPRWKWADPIATLFFVGLVVNSTRWLLQRAFNVLLEGVPDSIDYERLRCRLSEIEGVTDLHCLHVWSLTLGRTVVSAHLKAADPEQALTSAHEICEDMGVAHSTIQVQVDHCLPASCTHPCVSAVGSCCGPDGIGGSPLSASIRAVSPSSTETS